MVRSLINAMIAAAPDREAALADFKERAYRELAETMDILAKNTGAKGEADELSLIDKSIWAEFDWYMKEAKAAAANRLGS